MNCSKEGSITNKIFIQASAYLLSIWSTSARKQIIVDYRDTGWRTLKMKQMGTITWIHLTR